MWPTEVRCGGILADVDDSAPDRAGSREEIEESAAVAFLDGASEPRSEERRVGKEC